MAPKADESTKFDSLSRMDDKLKEKQRPPIYNPEDYTIWLKKWGKKSANGAVSLYSSSSMSDLSECSPSQRSSFRDYRNPMLSASGMEMTLRQFGSVSELLAKLKCDLRLAYPSFIQEFVADPLDGITLLLDLLRAIQLSQSNNGHVQQCSTGISTKLPPAVQRRTLLDELSCLQCLLTCCMRYSEAVRKLISSSAGLFTLAICIMSNVNKSRIIALQLLNKACEPPINGHSLISEAMSTLRLRFGEPVRFRFLIGMLSSAGGQVELLAAGLKFLNTFLNTAGTPQKRIYLQAELEQAGFDIATMKKNISNNANNCQSIYNELIVWEKNYIDIESLTLRIKSAEKENSTLRGKMSILEQKVKMLQGEKGILLSMDQRLREKCSELREEVQSLKSVQSLEILDHISKNQGDSTPDDEGISSSERTPTPEEEIQQSNSVFNLYNSHCNPVASPESLLRQDSEDETTIDDVIQELRDIISNEETEAHNKENSKSTREIKLTKETRVVEKRVKYRDTDDLVFGNDYEIVPANLLPQPPRKTRSLLHLFIPTEDYEYGNKELFFETESITSGSSFSIRSISKYSRLENKMLPLAESRNHSLATRRQPSRAATKRAESFRHSGNTLIERKGDDRFSSSIQALSQPEDSRNQSENTLDRLKCKSLDRIGDGLETFVDIVVTEDAKASPFRCKSDSGNVSSVSNVFVNTKSTIGRKLSTHSEEKQKMFLPSQGDQSEVLYYFPRVQEKRHSTSSSFLIGRGGSNAGLYSGQVIDDHHSYFSKSREMIGSDCRSSGKLTDFPSGLY